MKIIDFLFNFNWTMCVIQHGEDRCKTVRTVIVCLCGRGRSTALQLQNVKTLRRRPSAVSLSDRKSSFSEADFCCVFDSFVPGARHTRGLWWRPRKLKLRPSCPKLGWVSVTHMSGSVQQKHSFIKWCSSGRALIHPQRSWIHPDLILIHYDPLWSTNRVRNVSAAAKAATDVHT